MEVGSICCREVDTMTAAETAQIAAKRMLQRNVGSLVIVDDSGVPVGIVTDRDLALRVMAQDLPYLTPIEKVMSRDVRCVQEGHSLDAALNAMRLTPCRRLPVVDEDGKLIGIVTLDDIHAFHAEEAAMMSVVLRRENPSRVAEP